MFYIKKEHFLIELEDLNKNGSNNLSKEVEVRKLMLSNLRAISAHRTNKEA